MIVSDDQADLNLHTEDLSIRVLSGGARVYAERIQCANRRITLTEVSELLRLFEATGCSDIHWGNIIVAEDGVYIIDTEFRNFWTGRWDFRHGLQYFNMVQIVNALPIEQQQPLLDELEAKAVAYRQQEKELDAQLRLRSEAEVAVQKRTGCGVLVPSFTFHPNELFN